MLSRFENSDLICNRSQIQNEWNASIATNKMSDAPVNDRFQFNQFESISTIMVHGLNRTSVPFPEQDKSHIWKTHQVPERRGFPLYLRSRMRGPAFQTRGIQSRVSSDGAGQAPPLRGQSWARCTPAPRARGREGCSCPPSPPPPPPAHAPPPESTSSRRTSPDSLESRQSEESAEVGTDDHPFGPCSSTNRACPRSSSRASCRGLKIRASSSLLLLCGSSHSLSSPSRSTNIHFPV